MNRWFGSLLWLSVACLISWKFFVPKPIKFGVKLKVYKTLFKDPLTFDDGPNVTVNLSLGAVVGTTIKPNLVDYYADKTGHDAKSVHQFLGVPFAMPPVRELRFKKPKPVEKWSPKILEAFKWKPDCVQPNEFEGVDPVILVEAFGFAQINFSEDCLYLNIWTPTLPESGSKSLKPVLVWLHGSYTHGGSSMVPNHGYTLASTQDIVVVSFNHRLGPLGFAVTSDADLAPGNAGLWDQVLALEWIQNHIENFGGDPNQVTIAGVSGGAFSTSALMASPLTGNLFQNVVEMSGSSLIPSIFLDRNLEVAKTKHLAALLNCSTDNDQLMMECLIQLDAEKLLVTDAEKLKTFPGKESFGMGAMIFAPITGDDLLPDKTHRLLQTEDVKKRLKQTRILFGVVNFEGGIMKYTNDNSIIIKEVVSTIKDNKIDWVKGLTNYLVNYHNIEDEEARSIVQIYLNDTFQLTDQKLIDSQSKTALFNLIGDIKLTCPAMIEAETTSQYAKAINFYVFSYKSTSNDLINLICPEENLVCHGMDAGYWLGSVLLKSNSFFNDSHDYDQAIQTLDILGRFVRNEKLIVGENVEWEGFETKSKSSLEINICKNNPLINNFRDGYCNLIMKVIVS